MTSEANSQAIDTTPTFEPATSMCIPAPHHGTPEGKRMAEEELTRYACTLDTFAQHSSIILYALDQMQAQLRDDRAVMCGSEAGQYTDEEVAEIEERITSLDAALAVFNPQPQGEKA